MIDTLLLRTSLHFFPSKLHPTTLHYPLIGLTPFKLPTVPLKLWYRQTGTHFSDAFPINNCLKEGDALSPSLSNFGIEYSYAISRVQANEEGLKLNGTSSFRFTPLMLTYWVKSYIL
jgi:hypothetical protein